MISNNSSGTSVSNAFERIIIDIQVNRWRCVGHYMYRFSFHVTGAFHQRMTFQSDRGKNACRWHRIYVFIEQRTKREDLIFFCFVDFVHIAKDRVSDRIFIVHSFEQSKRQKQNEFGWRFFYTNRELHLLDFMWQMDYKRIRFLHHLKLGSWLHWYHLDRSIFS